MKKYLIGILSILMCFTLVACKNNSKDIDDTNEYVEESDYNNEEDDLEEGDYYDDDSYYDYEEYDED